MAKKALKPLKQYSPSDQCLIELLCEPVKKYKTIPLSATTIKKSEELLRSMIHNGVTFKVSQSSLSTT